MERYRAAQQCECDGLLDDREKAEAQSLKELIYGGHV